jgi:PAS domain S-box-containing protein
MKDERKTKKQLINELVEMRQRVAELESLRVECKQAEESQQTLTEALQAASALRESEERFRAVSELVSDFVYAIRVEPDGAMAYEWTTEALTQVTGFTVGELEERGGIVSLVHPDDRKGTLRRLRTLRSEPSSATDELRIFTKSGEMRWIRNYARSVWNEEQDRIVRIYGAVQDITERKHAEAMLSEQTRALQESEKRLRLLVESADDIINIQDLAGVYLYYSGAPRYGLEGNDVVGKTPLDFHERTTATEIMERLHQVITSGQGLTAETELTWQGETLWFADHMYPIKDTDGHTTTVATISRNITERKRAEQVLHRRTAQLEALREVGLEITAQLDLDILLHSLASWAMEMMEGVCAGVCLYRPRQDVLEAVVTVGKGILAQGSTLRRGEGIPGKVWETGESVIVDDCQHWVEKLASCEGISVGAMVGVPICWSETFLGVLSVASDSSHAFTQADAEQMNLFATQAAIAIRNAQLYEAERKRATQLAVVNQVARQAASILEPDQLLQEIVTAIQRGFGYFNVIILQLDETTNELGNQAVAGGFEDIAPSDYRQKVGEGLIGQVAETGRSLLVNDVSQAPQYIVGFSEDVPTQSELCVPLKLADQVVGVLDVQATWLNAFDGTDLAAMETLADQIAVAIKNAQLYERAQQELVERKHTEQTLQRRNRELAFLNRAGQEFAATLDLDQVLAAFLDEVCHLLDVTAGSVWLIDFETDEVVCEQAYGPENKFVQGWRLPLGKGITGWVARHSQSLVLSDAQVDERYYRGVEREMEVKFHSILSVPLKTRQKVIGTLQVVDTAVGRFDAADLALIESLAATAAVSIENARLYEQTRQDAETRATLLHEVNHRVKNNLSAIIGLIYAEQRHAGIENQAAYQSILTDLSHRVQGLAKVHALLSETGWAPLPLDELVGQIIWVALQMLPRHKHISVDVTPSPVQVTPERANDLALVINELATNTATHALAEQDEGHITVRIAQEAHQTILLEFRDDGPGYPQKVLTSESHNVGLYLIQSLVSHNLCGKLTLRNDEGAVTTIRFKQTTNDSQ